MVFSFQTMPKKIWNNSMFRKNLWNILGFFLFLLCCFIFIYLFIYFFLHSLNKYGKRPTNVYWSTVKIQFLQIPTSVWIKLIERKHGSKKRTVNWNNEKNRKTYSRNLSTEKCDGRYWLFSCVDLCIKLYPLVNFLSEEIQAIIIIWGGTCKN